MGTKIKMLVGVSAVIIGGLVLLAVGSTTGNATTNAECKGGCSNTNCAAADGGNCDCSSCPGLASCFDGSCGGACSTPDCGAKVGKGCGCGR